MLLKFIWHVHDLIFISGGGWDQKAAKPVTSDWHCVSIFVTVTPQDFSFGEIQTQNLYLYNINKTIIQTQKYLFKKVTPTEDGKVAESAKYKEKQLVKLCCPLRSVCLFSLISHETKRMSLLSLFRHKKSVNRDSNAFPKQHSAPLSRAQDSFQPYFWQWKLGISDKSWEICGDQNRYSKPIHPQ